MMSKEKAAKMLKEGMARGHTLTEKQRKMMQAVSHGWKPKGRK